MTAHTFGIYETRSCLAYLTFFKTLSWWFIMPTNCFQLLLFLLLLGLRYPPASLPTLQLLLLPLSVEI
jgi:hypothetical protein